MSFRAIGERVGITGANACILVHKQLDQAAERLAVPGTNIRLHLKLAAKAFKAVRSELKRHKKATAKITITATDSAGNVKREQRAVALRL